MTEESETDDKEVLEHLVRSVDSASESEIDDLSSEAEATESEDVLEVEADKTDESLLVRNGECLTVLNVLFVRSCAAQKLWTVIGDVGGLGQEKHHSAVSYPEARVRSCHERKGSHWSGQNGLRKNVGFRYSCRGESAQGGTLTALYVTLL